MLNSKNFWKLIYLYTTKYKYEVLYYKQGLDDIWLINNKNEVIRFIYKEKFDDNSVDSIVYNIVQNEKRLKKVFRLSNLKIKILFLSNNENILEYKKYKISNELSIERIILTYKNLFNFIEESDLTFFENVIYDEGRLKNRILKPYLEKDNINFPFNIKFNLISVFILLIYFLNKFFEYFLKFNLYSLIEYDYQKIISGQFYRLFTDILVYKSFLSVFIVIFLIFISSFIVGKNMNIKKVLIIVLIISFILNLFMILGQLKFLEDYNILSFTGILGAIFISQFKNIENNFNLIISIFLPIAYIFLINVILKKSINLGLYSFIFILGIFLYILFEKKIYIFFSAMCICLIFIAELSIFFTNYNLKIRINNYNLKYANERIINKDISKIDESIEYLEKDLNSCNKSSLTYYELGMYKIVNQSYSDAEKVFLDGINFDNEFPEFYFQLALIEYKKGNNKKSLEYIKTALSLSNKKEYKDFKNEISIKE